MDTKRVIDAVIASAALTVTWPVIAAAGVAIKAGSAGPVFYRSVRVGMNGRQFTLYKLRSMVGSAAESAITGHDDPRITPVGRWLRRRKLDELPQLFNVVRGDMSLVGPRPEDPRFVAHYSHEQREVLGVRPGITSPASLLFRREEAFLHGPDLEESYLISLMPAKLQMDLEYVQSQSIVGDVWILIRTARALFH